MHIVLGIVLILFFALIVSLDFWEGRCIERANLTRQAMIEKVRALKRSGAIDDITAIKLARAVHDVPFEEHVRLCMSRRDPAVLYPSELDNAD